MSRLAKILGIPLEETWPEAEEIRVGFWRLLVEGSEVLHRSNVAPTLAELSAFSVRERLAFAQAADRVRVRSVLDLAAAISGQAEEVAAELDGGASLLDRELEGFTDKLQESIQ